MSEYLTFEFEKDFSELANIKLPDPTLLEYYRRLERREIWCNQDIDESIIEWTQQIMDWNRDDDALNLASEDRIPIKIFINSNGGCLNSIMHFVTVIGLSKTPVVTVGMGKCYSSGGLLLMGGHKGHRYIFKSTHALVHDGSSGAIGDTGKVLDNLEYTKKLENETKEYILSHTTITLEDYDKNYRRDWWMDHNDILKYGLADQIITELSQLY